MKVRDIAVRPLWEGERGFTSHIHLVWIDGVCAGLGSREQCEELVAEILRVWTDADFEDWLAVCRELPVPQRGRFGRAPEREGK